MTATMPPGTASSTGAQQAQVGSVQDLILRVTDGRSMAEVEADPEIRLALSTALARHSPAGLAMVASRGRWKMAPHLGVMNDAITRTIAKPEGRLLLSVSVRAGKSEITSRYTPAWYLGTHPEKNVIIGAHEAGAAAEHAGFARDKLTEYGPALYGTQVNRRSSARNRWRILGRDGGMFAVGVGGNVIGKGADVLIVDDPFKNYEAAMSDVARRRVNESWFQGSLESRVEPGGSIIVVMARWHEDDLSGWLKSEQPGDWEEIYIPALCEDATNDILGRDEGESFWPERWTREMLEKRRDRVGPTIWNAQYQQRPSAPAGGILPVGKLRPITRAMLAAPTGPKLRSLCRGWDLAATEDDGDFTVGILIAQYDDDRWVILDLVRGQWGEAGVRTRMSETRRLDDLRFGDGRVRVELPQDPGGAGKSQAGQMTAMLSGALVNAETQSGSKVVRASGFAAQVQMGNVDYLVAFDNEDDDMALAAMITVPGLSTEQAHAMIEEFRAFDKGKHDDIVDAVATAFNRIADTIVVDSPVGSDAFEGQRRSDGLA